MDIDQIRKLVLESAVIVGLVCGGIYLFATGDTTNGAWCFGLAGGYVFKNGGKVVETIREINNTSKSAG